LQIIYEKDFPLRFRSKNSEASSRFSAIEWINLNQLLSPKSKDAKELEWVLSFFLSSSCIQQFLIQEIKKGISSGSSEKGEGKEEIEQDYDFEQM
jgi:hypothetical protein